MCKLQCSFMPQLGKVTYLQYSWCNQIQNPNNAGVFRRVVYLYYSYFLSRSLCQCLLRSGKSCGMRIFLKSSMHFFSSSSISFFSSSSGSLLSGPPFSLVMALVVEAMVLLGVGRGSVFRDRVVGRTGLTEGSGGGLGSRGRDRVVGRTGLTEGSGGGLGSRGRDRVVGRTGLTEGSGGGLGSRGRDRVVGRTGLTAGSGGGLGSQGRGRGGSGLSRGGRGGGRGGRGSERDSLSRSRAMFVSSWLQTLDICGLYMASTAALSISGSLKQGDVDALPPVIRETKQNTLVTPQIGGRVCDTKYYVAQQLTIILNLTLVWHFGHFCPCFFFYHFACVIASCVNFGTGVYFYWNFTISPPFPLINLFCTRYRK